MYLEKKIYKVEEIVSDELKSLDDCLVDGTDGGYFRSSALLRLARFLFSKDELNRSVQIREDLLLLTNRDMELFWVDRHNCNTVTTRTIKSEGRKKRKFFKSSSNRFAVD